MGQANQALKHVEEAIRRSEVRADKRDGADKQDSADRLLAMVTCL